MKNDKKINEIKKEMETLKKDFDKNYSNLEIKLKKLEKGNHEVGDIVTYKGLEWYVIKVEPTTELTIDILGANIEHGEVLTLMLKNKLNAEQLDKCGFTHDDYNDIVFNSDKTNNDWLDSNVRKCVNAFAGKYLDKSKLLKMRSNYDEDKYSDDIIRIPKLREIEKLPKDIRKVDVNSGYWAMTPSYGTVDTAASACVLSVYSYGGLTWGGVNRAFGVRPVIMLASDELE